MKKWTIGTILVACVVFTLYRRNNTQDTPEVHNAPAIVTATQTYDSLSPGIVSTKTITLTEEWSEPIERRVGVGLLTINAQVCKGAAEEYQFRDADHPDIVCGFHDNERVESKLAKIRLMERVQYRRLRPINEPVLLQVVLTK